MMEVSGSRCAGAVEWAEKALGRVRCEGAGCAGERGSCGASAGSARRRPPNRTRWSSRVKRCPCFGRSQGRYQYVSQRAPCTVHAATVMYVFDWHIVARLRTPRRGLTSRDQDIKIDCRINFYASPHERLGNRLPEIYCQNFPLVTLTEHTPRITISQIKEPVAISSSTINYMKLG